MLRRICSGILCFVLLCACVPTAQAVGTSASSAILMDAESGRVLYEHNSDSERAIASITKLMTALLVVERLPDLDATVEIDPASIGVEGSSMYLKEGETLTVRELLYGLLLNSGNDAATALACHCAGSEEAFAQLMNERAAELGMAHSHFVNPHGLSQEGHYSTARDMAVLTAECLKHEEIVAIASTKTVTIGGRTMTNHNKMLWQYEGCIGMKTGYTILAGRTLITCAQRDGQRLIAVTLNDGNDWADHTALLDYGFSAYPRQTVIEAGEEVITLPVTASLTRFVPVAAAETVAYPLREGEEVTASYDIPQSLEAPLQEGQSVGSITYFLDGAEIGSTQLVCTRDVSREIAKGMTVRELLKKILVPGLFGLPASG